MTSAGDVYIRVCGGQMRAFPAVIKADENKAGFRGHGKKTIAVMPLPVAVWNASI